MPYPKDEEYELKPTGHASSPFQHVPEEIQSHWEWIYVDQSPDTQTGWFSQNSGICRKTSLVSSLFSASLGLRLPSNNVVCQIQRPV